MKKKKGRNCKDGLTSRQEHLARQIRKELLDENKKLQHYTNLKNLWTIFVYENTCIEDNDFVIHLQENVPELYSAFKRLGLNVVEIAKN